MFEHDLSASPDSKVSDNGDHLQAILQTERGKDSGTVVSAERGSLLSNFVSSVRFLTTLHAQSADISLRKEDQFSHVLLIVSLFFLVLSQVMPARHFATILIADVMMAGALVFFLTSRFGILQTLLPRQALLIWQLIFGSCLLGIFLTQNFNMLMLLLSGSKFGPN